MEKHCKATQPPLYLLNTAISSVLYLQSSKCQRTTKKYKTAIRAFGEKVQPLPARALCSGTNLKVFWCYWWLENHQLPFAQNSLSTQSHHPSLSQGSVLLPYVISHPYLCLEGVSCNRSPEVRLNFFLFCIINALLNFTVKIQCIFLRTWILNYLFKFNFEAEMFQD